MKSEKSINTHHLVVAVRSLSSLTQFITCLTHFHFFPPGSTSSFHIINISGAAFSSRTSTLSLTHVHFCIHAMFVIQPFTLFGTDDDDEKFQHFHVLHIFPPPLVMMRILLAQWGDSWRQELWIYECSRGDMCCLMLSVTKVWCWGTKCGWRWLWWWQHDGKWISIQREIC